MGACVSVEDDDANGRVAEKRLIPCPSRLDGAFAAQRKLSSQHSITSWTSTGSNEEMFFDAQAWQECSSEDDFFSVNGDFVPSGASSPTHRSSFAGFPPATRTLSASRSSIFNHESPSFTEKKEPLDHGSVLPNYKHKKEIQLVQFFQDRFWTSQAGLLDHYSHPHDQGITHSMLKSKPKGP
ncbi:uncharacterized protein LOC115741491 [Rhodamnia argentea]|uniref:Uncharacterized protein LOC115741491 n=1 Tax=Rhodamnia argentea TaxID=178133 RepID=A0A8B8P939_9MYRT|nr:uncharacterized protein LOC115741491 [Rhodamnia argentea]XP_048136456.1 uncharacterized protein LOC115741491 [Rhodamnia argentea]